MKYLKTFEKHKGKKLKYKEGDFIGYNRYVNDEPIPVEILKTTPTSKYPYFVQTLNYDSTYVLQEDDVVELSEEQKEKIKLDKNIEIYNL